MIEFKDGLWYFAHPYTCKDANGNYLMGGEDANFRLCCIRSAKLIEMGYLIFSPVSHTHPIHINWPNFVGKQVHEMWYEFDNHFIRGIPFKGIILAPQWRESKGCCGEKALFEELGREVRYYGDIACVTEKREEGED